MCGISFLITEKPIDDVEFEASMNIQHRGPDYTNFTIMKLGDSGLYMSMIFHRLSIVDNSVNGAQPFVVKIDDNNDIFCICNAEIFNHEQLKEALRPNTPPITYKSSSDCEVIPYMYKYATFQGNYEYFFRQLKNNEFAFVIVHHDKELNIFDIFVARDPYGVRPLYKAYSYESKFICFSSELKGVPYLDDIDFCEQFKPMNYLKFSINEDKSTSVKNVIDNGLEEKPYLKSLPTFGLDTDIRKIKTFSLEDYANTLHKIRETLTNSVNNRLMSDRPLGALLSGGLDSSIVCAIASRKLQEIGKKLRTFSIGMQGSTDEYYAKEVAKYIGSEHTHFMLSKQEFQAACEETIWKVESYDCTTVRASVCQMLCAKNVAETTDIKVLLVGDGSDELFGGYMYFKSAPNPEEFHNECVRLVENIHLFDGQRSDRLIASYGMETRSPFQEDTFVRTVLDTDPNLRVPCDTPLKTQRGVIEKCLLRSAFIGYLPDECLWRVKEAFSDGVSGSDDSWYLASKNRAEALYTNEQFTEKITQYPHMTPTSKEELYYREIFGKKFSENVATVIPYRWMPKAEWVGNVSDPSARVLSVYEQSKPI